MSGDASATKADPTVETETLAEDGSVSVLVRLINGDEHTFSLPTKATVYDLRQAIQDEELCPLPCQQLLLGEEPLNDMSREIVDLGQSEVLLVIGVMHGVCEIYLNTGDVVDYICVIRRDGTSSECGNKGGSRREPFLLEPFEYITEVAWRRSDYYGASCLKGVRFTTSTGRHSGVYGKDGEDWTTVRAETGQQVSGLEMRRDHRGFVADITDVILE